MKSRSFALMFIIFGVCALGAGIYVYTNTLAFLEQAKPATGTVVEIAISTNNRPGKKERISLRPIVEFQTTNGDKARFKSAHGSSESPYSVGDTVPVLYDPTDPANARIDTFVTKYALEVILSGVGTVFLGIGLIVFLKS